MGETDASSGFSWHVRDALTHLHDPGHLQRSPLARFVRPDAAPRAPGAASALRQAILDAIEALRPTSEISPSSPASRTYLILRLRYVEGLDISTMADRLALSRSGYFAGQQEAVEGVVSVLRERWGLAQPREAAPHPLGPLAERSDYEALDRGRRGSVAIPLSRTRTNLPTLLTSFVGREREMAEVRRLLEATRLLTFTGTGGCGKTRLAVECARSLLDAYPDGVWLVELAPLADPGLLPQTVAFTLGVHEQASHPIIDALKAYLRARRLLMVLDTCEHLVGGCASLADALLSACPRLTILATSRQPLGVPGETNLRVPSLDSPPAEEGRTRESSLQAVLSHNASRLFLDRARSALPAFAPSLANGPAIGEICRRLDGIPLAIELAAARVPALSPDQIASRLDHDFHLLTGRSRTALPRHQTLKATLDWSHDLLSDQERVLLRRLSVFAGGFSLEAAEAVGKGDGIDELQVVNLLAQLVDKSLVEAKTGEGDARYRLLEPVRQYAWHRLEESGELPWARDRHLDWCMALGRQAAAELRGTRQVWWLDRLEQEHANLRAALGWSLETRVEVGLELAARLYYFWEWRCYYQEGYRWLTELLRRTPEGVARRARAVSLHGAANLANYAVPDCLPTVRRLREESLDLWRALGDRWETARTLVDVGEAARCQDDADLGVPQIEEAVAIARELGDRFLLGFALLYLAKSVNRGGDRARAIALLEQSLALYREAGASLHAMAHVKMGLAGLLVLEGDRARARMLLEEALATLREVGQTIAVGYALSMCMLLEIEEGDYPRARSRLAECVALGRDLNWWAIHLPYLIYLAGILECRQGELDRGALLLGAADSAIRGLSEPYHATGRPGYPELGDAATAAARAALGEEGFARVWAKGQAMTLEQAVEYALGEET